MERVGFPGPYSLLQLRLTLFLRELMNTRELGKSGIHISPLVLGGNVFGWTIDEATSFRLLDAFVAAGLNCVDTADIYSKWKPGNRGGESDATLGKWFAQR